MDESLLNRSISRLEDWLSKNGFAGLDPYTLQAKLYETAFYKRYGKYKLVKHLFFRALQIFPEYLLPILTPKPEINAKGLGLLAQGYLNLYELEGKKQHFQKASDILNWLNQNQSTGYPGCCWGYPFNWQSDIFIPAGTPSSVVTVTVGYSFLQAYKISKDESYLEVIRGISEFLTQSLNVSRPAEDEICFSYTPVDNKHVINANLFAGDFLAQASSILKDNNLLDTAKKVYNYTVRRQNPDGSFYYYGPEQVATPALVKVLKMIDHYHTGFVLRTLQSLSQQVTGKKENSAVEKGVKYYLDHLFNGYIPKHLPDRKYPVNIHSVSEALLVLNQFKSCPNAKDKLEELLPWAINNLQDKNGYFYYNFFPFRRVKIAYLRWGQAWMFYALTQIKKGPDME